MLNELEAAIQHIIVQSSAELARQIGHSVRQRLAAEFMAAKPGVAAPAAPKRLGRPPKALAGVAAAAKPGKRTRRSFKRRLITPAEIDAVMQVIAKKSGLTSVQIQKAAGIDAKQAQRVLGKLRLTKKVALKGKRSKATYSAA